MIDEKAGTTTPKYKAHGEPLAAGSIVILETGGGGGYGPLAERDPALIQRDLDEGYITVEGAKADYGVKVDDKRRVIGKV